MGRRRELDSVGVDGRTAKTKTGQFQQLTISGVLAVPSEAMPRPLRMQFPGAIYHIMNRGDRREPIFRDDADRRSFLATLSETCDKTGWQLHAWCLMGNHFHLIAETPQPNLILGMKWLLGTYTGRFNRRHRLSGHIFGGRYKSLLIDERGGGYLKTACDYVHLNPVRAGLVAGERKPPRTVQADG